MLRPSEKLCDLVLEQVIGEAGGKSARVCSFSGKVRRIGYQCQGTNPV